MDHLLVDGEKYEVLGRSKQHLAVRSNMVLMSRALSDLDTLLGMGYELCGVVSYPLSNTPATLIFRKVELPS
jgi:hypothetical protein